MKLATWQRGTMLGALVAGLIGCGGAAKSRPESPSVYQSPDTTATEAHGAEAAQQPASLSPGTGHSSAAGAPPAGGYLQPAATQPYPPSLPRYASPPAADASLGESEAGGDRYRALVEDFVVAESALAASGSSCVEACRALRSMQRATFRLCAVAYDSREQQRCQAAEARYRAARERVRSACTQCQQGPSLEPGAPIEDGS